MHLTHVLHGKLTPESLNDVFEKYGRGVGEYNIIHIE
jgi:hypothetical protein